MEALTLPISFPSRLTCKAFHYKATISNNCTFTYSQASVPSWHLPSNPKLIYPVSKKYLRYSYTSKDIRFVPGVVRFYVRNKIYATPLLKLVFAAARI